MMQREVGEWSERNFGKQDGVNPYMGTIEELGELSEAILLMQSRIGRLAHATLKEAQGIRGTKEEHAAAAKDAVGDLMIFLLDFCDKKGWDAETILTDTWATVRLREWYPLPREHA
jgi:NTP pyrophosphatase (non-canonical NTP hydrolase)